MGWMNWSLVGAVLIILFIKRKALIDGIKDILKFTSSLKKPKKENEN